ncbi:DUF4861 domain-containing protein [Arcicella lustrica]|uniref:DUF4861 domain-containing protein n=1 Tax=Arcicella lustrica TaxID=2984196 RepID=A0ABU5SIZ6_9BACT|nr:DUF4861 domain-containing protein [Arcicella sp. DC25W]MEA5427263.1 DUF4861 domain-containing protein [Arcicella sp. DC25W]
MEHLSSRKLKTVLSFGLLSLSTMCYAQKSSVVTFKNELSREKKDELIILKRAFLEKKLGKISTSKYVVFTSETKQPILAQYDDMNADGKWDEIVLLQSFSAKQTKVFKISVADRPATIKAVVRANVRHRRKNADDTFGDILEKDVVKGTQPATDFSKQPLPPFLTEGPAWENDKVGFRVYFDTRNAKDIWGKTTTQMVLDEVGVNPAINYHNQADWGMDVLKVGKSLGAGALALTFKNASGKDTLVRLGDNNFEEVQYEKVTNGPIRAVFRLKYKNWKIAKNLEPVQIEDEISIWGGQYFYESKVSLKNAPKGAILTTGIVNLHSKNSYELTSNKTLGLYTYDQQSENHDNLGMAILVPKNNLVSFGQTPNQGAGILNTYTVNLKLVNGKTSFRFYAGWEKSEDFFKTKEGFETFLKQEME